MSPTTIALAADLLTASGEEVTVRSVCRVLKAATGKAARWAAVSAIIKAHAHGEFDARATVGQHPGNTPTHNGQHSLPTRDNCLFELVDSSSVLRTSSSPTEHRPDAPQKRVASKKTGALRLPFDRDTLDARNAILAAVWKHLKPIIGRSTTYTDWRKRNAVIARSFAEGGFKPEHIVAAWEDAGKRRGETIRELSLVQKFIESFEVQLAGRAP